MTNTNCKTCNHMWLLLSTWNETDAPTYIQCRECKQFIKSDSLEQKTFYELKSLCRKSDPQYLEAVGRATPDVQINGVNYQEFKHSIHLKGNGCDSILITFKRVRYLNDGLDN